MVRIHSLTTLSSRRRVGGLCASLVLSLSFWFVPRAEATESLLAPAHLAEPPADIAGTPWRAVRVDAEALAQTVPSGTSLAIELLEGEGVEVVHRETIRNRSGSLSWVGDVVGYESAPVVLVSRDGVVIGSIRFDGRLYLIGYLGRDAQGEHLHLLHQVDERDPRFLEDEPTEGRPAPERLARASDETQRRQEGLASADDGSIHDLMVVYSQGAVDETGGVVAVENLIDLGVTETNLSYQASGIDHRLRLVHTSLTDYVEQSGLGCPRDLLQGTDDGVMDEVHAIRDQVAADLVMVIVGNAGGCGRAFIMNEVSIAHEEFAFCYVNRVCVSPGYTFQHELGHIQSGRHQRTSDQPDSPFPYNFGFTDPVNEFRTIMAAGSAECPNGCPRRLAWSNPDVLDAVTGTPMGIPETEELPTDMRKALNATSWTVANFRVSDAVVFADDFESGTLDAWTIGD